MKRPSNAQRLNPSSEYLNPHIVENSYSVRNFIPIPPDSLESSIRNKTNLPPVDTAKERLRIMSKSGVDSTHSTLVSRLTGELRPIGGLWPQKTAKLETPTIQKTGRIEKEIVFPPASPKCLLRLYRFPRPLYASGLRTAMCRSNGTTPQAPRIQMNSSYPRFCHGIAKKQS